MSGRYGTPGGWKPGELEAFERRQELMARGRCPNDDGDLVDDPEAPRLADGTASVRECKACGFVLTTQPIHVPRPRSDA